MEVFPCELWSLIAQSLEDWRSLLALAHAAPALRAVALDRLRALPPPAAATAGQVALFESLAVPYALHLHFDAPARTLVFDPQTGDITTLALRLDSTGADQPELAFAHAIVFTSDFKDQVRGYTEYMIRRILFKTKILKRLEIKMNIMCKISLPHLEAVEEVVLWSLPNVPVAYVGGTFPPTLRRLVIKGVVAFDLATALADCAALEELSVTHGGYTIGGLVNAVHLASGRALFDALPTSLTRLRLVASHAILVDGIERLVNLRALAIARCAVPASSPVWNLEKLENLELLLCVITETEMHRLPNIKTFNCFGSVYL